MPNEPIANSPLVHGGMGPASALTSKDAKTGEWVMQRNFPALHDPLSSYSNTWLKLGLE